MRTQGDFSLIFEAAAEHTEEEIDTTPHDAVVRKEGDIWMIESSIEPASDNCTLEVTLEVFQEHWQLMIGDGSTPTERDILDFEDTHSDCCE